MPVEIICSPNDLDIIFNFITTTYHLILNRHHPGELQHSFCYYVKYLGFVINFHFLMGSYDNIQYEQKSIDDILDMVRSKENIECIHNAVLTFAHIVLKNIIQSKCIEVYCISGIIDTRKVILKYYPMFIMMMRKNKMIKPDKCVNI